MREGRVPADALVDFEPVTGAEPQPAGELGMYQSLRGDAIMAFRDRLEVGPPPLLTALLVGVQLRIWLWAWSPGIEEWLLTHWMVSASHILEDGEVWRLLSAGLLQTSLVHLLGNVLLLSFTGWNLERALGWRNLAVLFFGSVFVGALGSMTMSPYTMSLGSSGGVFGLVAASIVVGLRWQDVLPIAQRALFFWFVLPYLVLSVVSGWFDATIDNWAHFGGFVGGSVIAWWLEPPSLEQHAGHNRRVTAIIAGGAAAMAVLFTTLGPRMAQILDQAEQRRVIAERRSGKALPAPEREAYEEVAWSVPASWLMGGSGAVGTGFVSPVGRREWRAWSVRQTRHDAWQTPASLAEAWRDQVRRSHAEATFSSPEPTELAGRSGLTQVATLPGEPARQITWRGTARGVWALEEQWRVDEAGAAHLEPLRDRLRASVVWHDPEPLRDALIEAEFAPDNLRRQSDLAVALGEAGELTRALELHQRVVDRVPGRVQGWVDALATVALAGADAEPEAWWASALREQRAPQVIEAVAQGLQAAGRTDEAIGVLWLAWRASPGDRYLRRVMPRFELPTTLDPGGQPLWDVVDPVSGAARTPPPRVESWTLVDAAVAGRAYRLTVDALERAFVDDVVSRPERALERLLWLREGSPALPQGTTARRVRRELKAAAEGNPATWMSARVAEAIEGHPELVQQLPASED